MTARTKSAFHARRNRRGRHLLAGGLITRRTAVHGVAAGLLAGCSNQGDLATRDDAIRRAAPSGLWATGGVAAMRDAANYPDPFAGVGQACSVTCEQILGPCWAPSAPVRQDISEGEPGVPMRLAFRLLDADGCTPMADWEIEVWHCNSDGLYSAEDVESRDFCTANDEHALSRYFFRGRAITDANGDVVFDACYPGWYSGRAVHIHLLARPPEHAGDGDTSNIAAVTQLYFPEALTEEIFASVDGYRDRGQPDTVHATDMLLSSAGDVDGYTFSVEQMTDGAMLAWKTIVISDSETCGGRQLQRSPRSGAGGFPGDRPSGRPPRGEPSDI